MVENVITRLYKNLIWCNDGTLDQSKVYHKSIRVLVESLKAYDKWFTESFFIISPRSIFVKKTLHSLSYNNYKRLIVIITDEENGIIEWRPNPDNNEYLFQCYVGTNCIGIKNVFSCPLIIPLDDTPNNDFIPINDRKFNVFFSGNLNRNRWGLYLGLSKKRNVLDKLIYRIKFLPGIHRVMKRFFRASNLIALPNSYLKFNNGFFSFGLPLNEYKKIMSNSKIILSPCGFRSNECYRTYEALKSGCVCFSESLPDTPFYRNIPLIQVDGWANVQQLLNMYLSDSVLLNKISKEASSFYDKNLSFHAIARYIYEHANGEIDDKKD